MTNFAAKRDINVQKIPPLHAAANPSETFMKPLGKTMKIARHQLKSEKEALQELLDNYRDTPHPATGITPSAMLFRDGVRKKFPCIMVDEKQVKNARERDARQKLERGEKINASKFRSESTYQNGDYVVLRNTKKTSKFDPYFEPDTCQVIEVSKDGRVVTVERLKDGKLIKRHPDDIKLHVTRFIKPTEKDDEQSDAFEWQRMSRGFPGVISCYDDESDSENVDTDESQRQGNDESISEGHFEHRRSTREKVPNRPYFNEDRENSKLDSANMSLF